MRRQEDPDAADVLVLGAEGTFGHVAVKVLSQQFRVVSTARNPDKNAVAFEALCADHELSTLLDRIKPKGLAVNAIAVLASDIAADSAIGREQAISVNSVFPNRLARVAAQREIRVLHISTDAVFPCLSNLVTEDDRIGPEDFYGITKSAGELTDAHCITLRCSIIGPPAPKRSRGLWAWVAGQGSGATLRAFVNQSWSGLTTHQLATTCANLVDPSNFARVRRDSAVHHLAPNPVGSKFEVVKSLASVLRPDLTIEAARADKTITRALASRYTSLTAMTPRFDTWTDAIAAAIN